MERNGIKRYVDGDPKGLSFRDSTAARNGAIGSDKSTKWPDIKSFSAWIKSQLLRKHLGTFIANILDTGKRKIQVSSQKNACWQKRNTDKLNQVMHDKYWIYCILTFKKVLQDKDWKCGSSSVCPTKEWKCLPHVWAAANKLIMRISCCLSPTSNLYLGSFQNRGGEVDGLK